MAAGHGDGHPAVGQPGPERACVLAADLTPGSVGDVGDNGTERRFLGFCGDLDRLGDRLPVLGLLGLEPVPSSFLVELDRLMPGPRLCHWVTHPDLRRVAGYVEYRLAHDRVPLGRPGHSTT
jgi:hypothetical protein